MLVNTLNWVHLNYCFKMYLDKKKKFDIITKHFLKV